MRAVDELGCAGRGGPRGRPPCASYLSGRRSSAAPTDPACWCRRNGGCRQDRHPPYPPVLQDAAAGRVGSARSHLRPALSRHRAGNSIVRTRLQTLKSSKERREDLVLVIESCGCSNLVIPAAGELVSGDTQLYNYLVESIHLFPKTRKVC